jgi:hypothetical protein
VIEEGFFPQKTGKEAEVFAALRMTGVELGGELEGKRHAEKRRQDAE